VSIGVLIVAGVVPAMALGGVWQYAEANVPSTTTTTTTTLPPSPGPQLTTDLFSLRRHPTPTAQRLASEATTRALESAATELTSQIPNGSCLSIGNDNGVIAEIDPQMLVIPASNQKILVAAVALKQLGGSYRFRTELRSLPPVGGVVPGDVVVVGGGDPVLRTADVSDPLRFPSFNTTDFEDLADQLLALGITAIEGDIVGDGSRYDDEFRAPSWGDDITNADAGPYDALMVNDGLIGNGNYGLNPSRSAARVFFDLLRDRGIAVTGAAANETRPADPTFTTLAVIDSLPMSDVLVEMLHTSDNNTAELMVKEIGFSATGIGTRQSGLDVIRKSMLEWGVPSDGFLLFDGSGLSRENRITCSALATLLTSVPVSAELRELLPVAGRDGTLASEFIGTLAEGRLQAKTGTLTDVKALSGVLPAGDQSLVGFSVILNSADADEPDLYAPVWERLIGLIDAYPIVIEPDIAELSPR
jgi:D-alanyl-D-alanine carboxypeptidase/D-alanyl-D-alanine-endopeptidase (penicillin-binding protein 4)